MDQKYSRDQIREAFSEWIKRAKEEGWKSLPDAQDADVSADYLVELMDKGGS
jgi:hypothetical protein